MGMTGLDEHFTGPLDPRWRQDTPGGGELRQRDSVLRLSLAGATTRGYSNAQLDDYSGLPGRRFLWRPPLRLEVRARASHPAHPPAAPADAPTVAQRYLRGTAGFGFWNSFLTLAGGLPRLPEAVWFLAASPPADMALVPGLAGRGWKAQVVHAQRWDALVAGVPAAGAVAWARVTGRERLAARLVRRVAGAHEAQLETDLCEWHDYAIDWRREQARFWVDGVLTLVAPDPPPGPLGFVAWIDNQYAIATPRGQLRFGLVASGPEWLELDSVRITPLSRER
jgi:hypothetical protein